MIADQMVLVSPDRQLHNLQPNGDSNPIPHITAGDLQLTIDMLPNVKPGDLLIVERRGAGWELVRLRRRWSWFRLRAERYTLMQFWPTEVNQ
ncbi:hypothetical protein [Nocardia nova]|uniref:hypothetical protein n=1 Tax=Nocardia nova TaxID=37330 RepID=UPI0018963C2A|nr:hypothetical protein [Nocardia nova]MBF6277032.1 hypothetical protein [Nocardia nova]